MSDDDPRTDDAEAAADDAVPAPPADASAPDESAPDASAAEVSLEDRAPEPGAADVGADTPSAESEPKKPDWKPPPPERLEGAIEALLLVGGDVMRVERLRDLLGLQSVVPVREAIAAIAARWEEAGLAFEIEQVGGGVRVVTRPEYAEYVGRLSRRPASDKLSRAQLETLCIVAYKQPVGRAEVERIRGVQAGEPLRALLERRLLKIAGRSDQPGRPLLYGTTQLFLTAFGLNDLKDLPAPKDMQRL